MCVENFAPVSALAPDSLPAKIPDGQVCLHACSPFSPGFCSPSPALGSFLLRFPCSAPSKPTGLLPDSVSFHLSVGSLSQTTPIPETLCPWSICHPDSPAVPSLSLTSQAPSSRLLHVLHLVFSQLLFFVHLSSLCQPLLPANGFNYSAYTASNPRPHIFRLSCAVGYVCDSLLEMRVGPVRGALTVCSAESHPDRVSR